MVYLNFYPNDGGRHFYKNKETTKQKILKNMVYGLGHNTHLSLIMQYEFRESVS